MKQAQLIFPKRVPKKFVGKFPEGRVNNVNGWFFTEEEVKRAAEKKQMLTMDIDMSGKGICSLKCSHCFRRTTEFKHMKSSDFTDFETLLKRIDEAIKLGLKSVKLIGPGEPLEDPRLIRLLTALHERGITTLIFTKAYILGEDERCKRIHGIDGQQLICLLKKLDVSILLGATSFCEEKEDAIVGKNGFHSAREAAIVRLCETGFNDFIPGRATRLALCFAPMTPHNVDEIFDAFVWVRERNIQPVFAPTMVSGNALDRLGTLVLEREQIIELYVRINVWAITHDVYSLEDIQRFGISAYAGGHWCNQVSTGVFMRGDGKVLRCPGDDITVLGDLKERPLTEIWLDSENIREYSGKFNNGCPPKEGKNSACARSFPEGFFEEVKQRVLEHFSH